MYKDVKGCTRMYKDKQGKITTNKDKKVKQSYTSINNDKQG